MFEIRIRHEYAAEAAHLCHLPEGQTFEDIIALVQKWGVVDSDGEQIAEFSGQFVIDSSGAYFEIIGHPAEAGESA